MIRNRDICALVLLVILSRMAYDESSESLTATASLAFFLPRDKRTTASVLTPMDVDGDGTSEALAVAKLNKNKEWVLEILDLKRLHQKNGAIYMAPFQPKSLFTSEPIKFSTDIESYPVKLTSAHLVISDPNPSTSKGVHPDAINNADINDTNRHYFCGKDWHDAVEKCGTPCPQGQSSDCPEDERCFADTACDILNYANKQQDENPKEFMLTPGGGLPSLITLWSSGDVTLHSLMIPEDQVEEEDARRKRRKNKYRPNLQLREQWNVNILPPNQKATDFTLWEEFGVEFLDSHSSQHVGATNGMIVLSGAYFLDGLHKKGWDSFVLTIDALTGKVIWKSFLAEELFEVVDIPLPLTRGSTSFARRRSRIPALKDSSGQRGAMIESFPTCQEALKHHMKELLPFSFWGPRDAGVQAVHLDLKRRDQHKRHTALQHSTRKGDSKYVPHKRKNHHRHPIVGRPNVLVVSSRKGLQVRSLKNGSPVCHMSLLDETVYTDLNNDGITDQVQILLDSKRSISSNSDWVKNVQEKVLNQRRELKDKGRAQHLFKNTPRMCHAMALSGVPANEELFSTSICSAGRGINDPQSMANLPTMMGLDNTPPIIVESLAGRKNTRDIVVALNNGMVHRLQGRSGRREWTTIGSQYSANFPTWSLENDDDDDDDDYGTNNNALLTRIPSTNVGPAIQPILLAGENSMAVLSVKNGAVLASAEFPQTSIARPVLAEVSGDGTADVLVLSHDAIWGYQVSVFAGSKVFLRISTGLLYMGLLLALLANRFGGQKKDKRSTDI